MMSKFNSPFRYPGGKAKLTTHLTHLIKNNKLRDGIYIEPYCGGAGAAINLLFSEVVSEIIINDFDDSVYSAWYSMVNESEKFINKIKETSITINEWKKQKEIFSDDSSSIFDKGFATFFLNRTNRSGILTGGVIGGLEQEGKWKIKARFNKKTLIDRIEKIALYKDRIKIFNLDGQKLLTKVLPEISNSNHFIYLDPPYLEKGATLYYNSFDLSDHKNLANFVKNEMSDHYWMISYDKNDTIKNLYNEFRIEDYTLNYSASKFKKGKELFIYNDNVFLEDLETHVMA
jgi:DNA adenine methylase